MVELIIHDTCSYQRRIDVQPIFYSVRIYSSFRQCADKTPAFTLTQFSATTAYQGFYEEKRHKNNFMLSSTVIGVELHRLGLKFNFGQVEVQRGEAELNFNLTKIELEWSCTR